MTNSTNSNGHSKPLLQYIHTLEKTLEGITKLQRRVGELQRRLIDAHAKQVARHWKVRQ